MKIFNHRTIIDRFLVFLKPVSLTECARDERIRVYLPLFVSIFYYATPMIALLFLSNGLLNKHNFEPIWPLAWSHWFNLDFTTTVLLVKLTFVGTAILSTFLHRYRTVRLLLFLMLWQVHALESSFGHWNHQWYGWLYVSLLLVFIPDIWTRTELRLKKVWRALLVIWTAQALLMLTYTMAGVHKLVKVVEQYQLGEVHGFAKMAFAYQAAWWVPQLQSPAYLLDAILAYPYIAWVAYSGLIVLQLFAWWCMVRVSLQLVWGVLFVLFHIGTFLAMGITFTEHVLLLCVFFLASPFSIQSFTLKQRVFDLPVIGQLLEYFSNSKQS